MYAWTVSLHNALYSHNNLIIWCGECDVFVESESYKIYKSFHYHHYIRVTIFRHKNKL
jgi:hypothetical protein